MNEELQELVGKTIKEISNGHGSCYILFTDGTEVYFDTEYREPEIVKEYNGN